MKLYAHPFSSYSQKVLIALYENDVPFDYLNLEATTVKDELASLWPLKRFPVLVDRGRTLIESSTIIEYLQCAHPGPHCLVPEGEAGIEVRMLDRLFDNYVMTPMQKVVLDKIYPWLDQHLAGRTWAAGEAFTLADCAGAPSLFYADWAHEIPPVFTSLRAYRARLLGHPSVVRVVNEARPYRHYFPLGAPARD